eukprot:SAG31_NODE_2810_length_5061_cov_12.226522_7_plen_195_part_00
MINTYLYSNKHLLLNSNPSTTLDYTHFQSRHHTMHEARGVRRSLGTQGRGEVPEIANSERTAAPPTMPAARAFPRIAEVRAYVRGGGEALQLHHSGGRPPRNSAEAAATATKWIDGVDPWPPIANPMSVHDQYAGPRSSWGKEILGQVVVEVVAEDGTSGCGIANGGEPGCFIVERHLARFVEGQDPRNVELMW